MADNRKPWLKSLAYDQAQMHYDQGTMSQDEWEWYCWKWRNGAFRYSSLAADLEGKPEPAL